MEELPDYEWVVEKFRTAFPEFEFEGNFFDFGNTFCVRINKKNESHKAAIKNFQYGEINNAVFSVIENGKEQEKVVDSFIQKMKGKL